MGSEIVVGAFTLGGVVLGGLIGAFSALKLEERREDRQRKIAQAAVVLELALLSAALKAAALDREMRRTELNRPYWQKFGPELINFLPDYLVKAMHLLLEDGFDSLRHAYAQLKRGVNSAYWPAAQVFFLSWAYHADRINEMIGEYSRTGRISLSVGPDKDMLLRVTEDAEQYALRRVQAHGLDTTIRLAVPDDGDLTVPPSGQPSDGKHVEFVERVAKGETEITQEGVKEDGGRGAG